MKLLTFSLSRCLGQAAMALTLTTGSMFASLVPIGSIPSSGNGLGAVFSVVTFQNTGTEYGCVGNVVSFGTGPTQCAGIVGGDVTHEQTGSGNNVYTAGALGITPAGANTFANVILIFNGNEGGGADAPITLTQLSLNLFTATGTLLGSFSLPNPYPAVDFPGAGSAGFGFQLDFAQSVTANALLTANPDLVIGASAAATGANSGPETIFISRLDTVQLPETSSTAMMLSGVLAVLAGSIRRRK